MPTALQKHCKKKEKALSLYPVQRMCAETLMLETRREQEKTKTKKKKKKTRVTYNKNSTVQ